MSGVIWYAKYIYYIPDMQIESKKLRGAAKKFNNADRWEERHQLLREFLERLRLSARSRPQGPFLLSEPQTGICGSDTGGGFFSIQWAAGVARVADRGLGHRRVKPWSSHRFCPLAYGSEPVAALMLDNRRSLLDPWNGRLGALLEILLVSGDQGALGLRSSWANSWRRRRHFSPIFLRASSPIPRVISSISSRLVNNP